MGGAGFAALFGSSPIILVQTVEALTPDTASLGLVGQSASVPPVEEAPTLEFVLTFKRTLQFTTGM